MTQKTKKQVRVAAHTIVLGEERADKIRRFCAKAELEGRERPTLPNAVNLLLDKALALEQV